MNIASILSAAEINGDIIFHEGQPHYGQDLELMKSVEIFKGHQEVQEFFLKGKAYGVGTVREWRGGRVKKISENPSKWAPVDKKGRVIKATKVKKKPVDELARKKFQKGFARYKAAVLKLDPRAIFVRMFGLKPGRGVMVNEKTNTAYLVSTRGGVRGDVIRKVNLNELRRSLRQRRKSAGIRLDEVYDRLPPEEIERLIEQSDPITVTVGDPMVKYAQAEQRAFRVVDGPNGQVVLDGAYRGLLLDDMITTKQRLRGSGGWVVDSTTGQAVPRYKRTDKGRRMVNVFHEPFAKREGGFARIYIPKGDEYSAKILVKAGAARQAKTGHVFKVSLTNIMSVVEALGSIAMDKDVAAALNAGVAKRNSAMLIKYENMKNEMLSPEWDGYRGHDIPGMKKMIGGNMFTLRMTQMQAVRKMTTDPSGAVLGLDTGLGKTLAGVCYHMKMKVEDKYHKGNNGKMVIISLGSNMATWKEHISTFSEGNDDWNLKDGIWYSKDFTIVPASLMERRYGSTKPTKGKDFELNPDARAFFSDYGSILMDEPQEYMKSTGTRIYQTMVNLDHNRKIISSESVMTKNPAEILNYVHIKDNSHDPEVRKNTRAEFASMFTGGRAKHTKEEFMDSIRTYIRDNIIYFHKTDEPMISFAGRANPMPNYRGEENADRHDRTISLGESTSAGHKEMLTAYQEKAEKVAATLEGMYRDFEAKKGKLSPDEILGALKSNKISGIAEIGKEIGELRSFVALPENHIKSLKGKNPKIEKASVDVKNHSANGRTSLAFAMKPELVIKSAKRFSEVVPNKISVSFTSKAGSGFTGKSIDPQTSALGKHNGQITFWHQGKAVWEMSVDDMRKRGLQMTEVLDDFKSNNPGLADKAFASISATDVYNAGHNLQNTAQAVLHLDRDNWNPKVIYQRESRVVRPNRQGWVTRGTIHTYDIEMPEGMHRSTDALERIRAEHEIDLFNQIVFNAKDVELEKPAVEFKTAKQVFAEGRMRETTRADGNSLLAGMGGMTHRIRSDQDQGKLLATTRLDFEPELLPAGAM